PRRGPTCGKDGFGYNQVRNNLGRCRSVPSFSRFDKYVLSKLMALFSLFAVVLVGVYWINQAVRLFDHLISDGQSAGVFVEITLLTLPNAIRITLPVAAFAASLYVASRLISDSELVVVQAAGWNRWRLMRPAMVFGVFVALLISILTHIAGPISARQLAERQEDISANISSRLLTEGELVHPTDGISFYVREVALSGELSNIFLMDTRSSVRNVTYTAKRAFLVRHETGPKLAMFDGMVQSMSLDERRLAVTQFERLVYDVAALVSQARPAVRMRELTTRELLWPDALTVERVDLPPAVLLAEGHGRVSQALIGMVAALAGFAGLMLGSLNRFGTLKQVIGAVVALIGLKLVDNLMINVAGSNPSLWPLVYFASALGLAAIAVTLISERPDFPAFRRRRRA
ncbi:MAG: LptF/LptG family permease, partial [Rhodobacter sp.]|nr:LptF/LptG family permease [Rhodobacter sp.]